MKRREFIGLFGGVAVAWPHNVRAQQPAMPVIGFLGAPSLAPFARYIAAVHQGLKETGYVEGQNMTTISRWAEGHYERLPALAADLVSRHVSVIIPIGGAPPTMAAKAATSTIPIVFNMAANPLELGLVASLGLPGGNVTGVAMMGVELEAKRLELLREVVPTSALIGMIVNPSNAQAEAQSREVQRADRAIGQQVLILSASTDRELDAAFAALVQKHVGALMIGTDTVFTSKPTLLAALAARYAMPAIYGYREFVEAGGLMSYGASLADVYRQTGIYAGRILNGAKPSELPVTQPTKFELVVNLKTAKALGLTIPQSILLRTDEVIE